MISNIGLSCGSMETKRRFVTVFTIIAVLMLGTQADHFRGATISWKSLGGRKVEFHFNIGWLYGKGSGCTQAKIGQLVTGRGRTEQWRCWKGCVGTPYLHTVNSICTGANRKEKWEQGENTFTHTFPNDGPFEVGFIGTAWIRLSNGKGKGAWNVATTVDLRKRSDTGTINSSPVSRSKPMYYEKFDCETVLRIPVADDDDDNIRCRWAKGGECQSVCNALPGARLDEKTCTLHFDTSKAKGYISNGIYAVAVTIEDYPKIPMTLGTVKKTPKDPLSSVPVQFLIKMIQNKGKCDDKPQFVSPSPKENEVIIAEDGDNVVVHLFADNGNDTNIKIKSIKPSGVVGMKSSPLVPDVNRTNTFTTTLTWQTATKDIGNHLVCGSVTNTKGIQGTDRCFAITIVPRGCGSNPCQNGAKCQPNKGTYSCACRPGFNGRNCEINIDDCAPNPCKNGATCVDGINTFTCKCVPGYTGNTCQTDIDECQPNPCQNGANCTDGINTYTCTCPPVFTGLNCSTLDHCIPDPCKNNALCVDLPTTYFCLCKAGYKGKTCLTDIDECAGNPCLNGGKCLDQIGKFTCVCTPGYTGILCQTGHNYCNPHPCNGGACVNGRLGLSCKCPMGWTGKTCNIVDAHPTHPPLTTTTPVNTKPAPVGTHAATSRTTSAMTRKTIPSVQTPMMKCPLAAYECDCRFSPEQRRDVGVSRTVRYVLAFFYGIPFGLLLSVFTCCLFGSCATHRGKDGKEYLPRSKPGNSPRSGCLPYCYAQDCDECRFDAFDTDCPQFKRRLECIERGNLCKDQDKETIRANILSDPEYCPDLPNGECGFSEGNKCVRNLDYGWSHPTKEICQKVHRIYESVMTCLAEAKVNCLSSNIEKCMRQNVYPEKNLQRSHSIV